MSGERPDTAQLREAAGWWTRWIETPKPRGHGWGAAITEAADWIDAHPAPAAGGERPDGHLTYLLSKAAGLLSDVPREGERHRQWRQAANNIVDEIEATIASPAPAASPVDEPAAADAIRSLAATAFANSERWFPGVHERGGLAVTMHLALGLGGEAGEVLDVIKKADICGLVESCELHADGKHGRTALGAKMADLFTYLLNLAHHLGIDLVAEFEAKQAVCAERWDR